MAYGTDYRDAALRHQQAAELLDREGAAGRPDVAAYLFGMAAECALKELMRLSGMRPGTGRDDPFHLHFPELKTALRDSARGRWHGRLSRRASDDALLNGWDVRMRYAPREDVLRQPARPRWGEQSRDLIGEMEELS